MTKNDIGANLSDVELILYFYLVMTHECRPEHAQDYEVSTFRMMNCAQNIN